MHVKPPIIGKRTQLGQAFDEMMKKTFPINYWVIKKRNEASKVPRP